jgi:hypothetical protein
MEESSWIIIYALYDRKGELYCQSCFPPRYSTKTYLMHFEEAIV